MSTPDRRESATDQARRVLDARVAREAAARTTGSVTVVVRLRDGVPTAVECEVKEANPK